MKQESEQLAAGFLVLHAADFVARNFVADFVARNFVADFDAAAVVVVAAAKVDAVVAAAVLKVHSVDAKPRVQTVQHGKAFAVELVAFVGA